jgi:CRP/FNR family cyclic AMP-dependent transcriptional regulator
MLDFETASAIERSRLAKLPADVLERLTADAIDLVAPAGSVVHPDGTRPFSDLVVRGLVRVFASSADGRQFTARYVRPGELVGIASLFTTGYGLITTMALKEARLLVMRPSVVRELALTDQQVSAVLLAELSDRVVAYQAELAGSTFASLRQKVARHLLDVATPDRPGGGFTASITQQELGDAVGTSREVVVRILHDLREAGLVETRRDRILLPEPDRLFDETWPSAR